MGFLDSIGRFIDLLAILIVFGGTLAITALRSTRADLGAAGASLAVLFRADPAADALAARVAVGRIEALAQVRTIACVDRVTTAGPFLRQAALELANAASARGFALWAEDAIAARRARHDRVAAVWRAAADGAPAMGMVGTVVALIAMFGAMDDPAAIGPAMAVAMLTTLYGLVLGNVVAGPIAARLERLSEEEAAWQDWVVRRLALLAQAELDTPSRVVPLQAVA
ncbi:MotA/TolQ/ExbB proton channel family protein [Sphingomonas montana]|uniref:MotA/TolQ/ExbB proton channel family protein n=1 Tax=Sphingomonas montana TaxID=1843236 RepID=UPI00096FFE33|nr:MotA/TolQ/ExbB proton channel family protein [Sphingomonas montana]